MPSQLRDVSPNAPNLLQDFNLQNVESTTNTRPATPVEALPQRPNFATQTIRRNNTTQPFATDGGQNVENNLNQGQRNRQTTTTSYRRRDRRNRQDQYRNMPINNNRFAAFEENAFTDIESNYGDYDNNIVPTINNKNKIKQNKNVKKQRLYLEPNRIMRYMQDNASTSVSGRGNQAYVLATTSIYDNWVRNNYELQVWQTYLKMGTEQQHWAKEVVQRTKRRDGITNTRFVQKKINRLTAEIAQAGATISDLQIQLGTYWTQQTTAPVAPAAATAITTTTTTNRAREPIDRLEKSILKYIQHCTQHVKKMAENKTQLAKAQMQEFKALEDFEQIATPSQWNIHLLLKPKMKIWNTKNKNCLTATKRVEYDLPPKFIEKTDLTFKIDESIIDQQEAQDLYNQMRQITKDFSYTSNDFIFSINYAVNENY